jgi:hypothetical protein
MFSRNVGLENSTLKMEALYPSEMFVTMYPKYTAS